MKARTPIRWRWRLKTALASTISRAHDSGLTPALGRRGNRPLVLGYHRVVEDFGAAARNAMPSMLISARMFERHLDYLARSFRFIDLDELGYHIAAGKPFEHPVAAVTFDDGYRDVYEQALPILKRKGIPAAMFVVTDLIDKRFWQVHDKLYHLVSKAFDTWPDPMRELRSLFRALRLPSDCLMHQRGGNPMLTVSSILPELPLGDVRLLMDGLEGAIGNGFHDIPPTLRWSDIADMRKGGITIGSHTKTHVSLPMESAERMADELESSRRLLEERLGEPIRHFAYPGGQFTPAVVDAVERAGYEFAYTACCHGVEHHPALTIERLLLWQGSSVDADGRFSPAILNCQAQDLWPPARRCGRVHESRVGAHG